MPIPMPIPMHAARCFDADADTQLPQSIDGVLVLLLLD